jgi:hypothetical protein
VRRVVAGPAQLVGAEESGCSQSPPGTAADTWCAFYRPAEDPARTELWTVNVSQAGSGPVPCNGSDPRCIRLTSNLWTGNTIFSPAHPEIHSFDGGSLLFYADATPGSADDPYIGPVRVWRPGWAEPRTITTAQGYVCYGHLRAAVAFCLDSVVQTAGNTEFDLLAGPIADSGGGPLPRIDHIRVRGTQGQVLWGASFSPDGDYLASSSPPADVDVEVLRVAKIDGGPPTSAKVILGDAARWQISADGKKVYFIKEFGVDAAAHKDVDRWGTLMVADFPTGANPAPLAMHVPGFLAMSRGGNDAGVAYLQDTVEGAGFFRVMSDRQRPQDVVTVDKGVEYFELSPDLRYAFLEEPQSRDGSPEGLSARTDGKASCIFTVKPGYPVVHPVFISQPRLLFWGDEIEDAGAFDLEGWYADPETCTPKKRFTPHLSRLTAASDGIFYGEYKEMDREREVIALKHARLTDSGFPADGGELIGSGVDVHITVADRRRQVVFTISKGPPEMQGLYAFGPLP